MEKLVNSNDWWCWHDIVVVSVKGVEQIETSFFLNVFGGQIIEPCGFLWVAVKSFLSSVNTIGMDKWLPTEIGGRDVDNTTS
jgi:hypothetical protein